MWYRDMRYLQVFRRLMVGQQDPRDLGRHSLVSELRCMITLELMGMALDHCIQCAFMFCAT